GKKLGVEIRTSASVAQIEVRDGRACSVVLEDGSEVRGRMILSNADPKRTFYTLVPSLEFAERCYDIAKFGEIPEELWVDCVVSSNADPSLAPPGKHI